jgi:hypothetical protein
MDEPESFDVLWCRLSAAAEMVQPHNCYAPNWQHYEFAREYVVARCGRCGRITGFKWRRVWARIRSLFTESPEFITYGMFK